MKKGKEKKMNIRDKTRAYFAHSMLDYNTAKEKKEYSFLRKLFHILCPNKDVGKLSSMAKYLNLVGWSEMVIVSEHKGFIGRGVFDEIKHALKLGIQVQCIRPARGRDSFRLVTVRDVEVYNSGDWKRNYGKLITN
jgi:hypothetical protein